MQLVMFLKGANVGGNRIFQPAALARDMADFGVVNVGAAGTFVALEAPGQASFRAEMLRRLPFSTEVMIVPAPDLVALADSDPFPEAPAGSDIRKMVSVLAKAPARLPRLPVRRPDGPDWQVEFCRVSGRFVLSFWRPDRARLLYADAGKEFGVPATTRTWKTVEKIRSILSANGRKRA